MNFVQALIDCFMRGFPDDVDASGSPIQIFDLIR